MGHATNSPSVFYRRMKCPGSKRLEAPLPDKDNEYSLKGTAAHYVAEKALEGPETPAYWLDQNVGVMKADGTEETIKITKEDVDAVWVYYDYAQRRKQEMEYCNPRYEEKVSPGDWMGGRDDMDGTSDCILYGNTEIEVIDYKHGVNAVEAENNTQLLLYAIGACARIDWTYKNPNIPVCMTIVQPRAPHEAGPVRSSVIPAHDLVTKAIELRGYAEATDDPEAPLVFDGTGQDWCRWCKARRDAVCPEVNKAAMEVFTPVNSKEPGMEWDAIEANLGRPASVLTIEQMTNILDRAPMFRSWLKSIEEHATELALDGTEFPGRKLVATVTRRKWALEPEEIIKKLQGIRTRDKKALGKDVIIKREPISIAQAEKEIKPLVSNRVWENLEKLVIKPEGKPTLVPNTDKRPALKTVEQVFEPVVEAAPWE